jgi:hypothetical protein
MSEKLVAIQGPDAERQYGQGAIVLVPFDQAQGLAEKMELKYVHRMVSGGYIVSERPGAAGLKLTLRSKGPRTVETVSWGYCLSSFLEGVVVLRALHEFLQFSHCMYTSLSTLGSFLICYCMPPKQSVHSALCTLHNIP